MLSIRSQIQWRDPLTHLQRYNQTITGINTYNQIIQIDTRNQLTQKIFSFKQQQNRPPAASDIKFLNTNYGKEYYFSFEKKIVTASGIIVDQSNSKADFVRGLDAKEDFFVFGKYHLNHKKYSLNTLKIGQEKKIVKLFDEKINKVYYINEKQSKSILLETADESIRLFYGENWQHDEELPNINRFEADSNYIYLMSLGNKGLSSKENENKYSPNKNNKSQSFSINKEQKVRVQGFQRQKLAKGKGYSEFQFSLSKIPIKIDSFQFDIFIAFDDSFEIYDIRKLTKPFNRETEQDIKDFYYDPNLQRIFLSCERGLQIYDYK